MKLRIYLGLLLFVLSGVSIFGSDGQSKMSDRSFVAAIASYSMEIGGGFGSGWDYLLLPEINRNQQHSIHHKKKIQELRAIICRYNLTSDVQSKLHLLKKENEEDQIELILGQGAETSTAQYWNHQNQLDQLHYSKLLLFSCEIMKKSMSESDMNLHLRQTQSIAYTMNDVESFIKDKKKEIEAQLLLRSKNL